MMQKGQPNLKLERIFAIIAWVAWVAVMAGVAMLVRRSDLIHNDCGIYRGASEQWWAGAGLYANNRGIDGFLYFPQFVLLYSPFAALGFPVGDTAWRVVGLALFVTGLWRVSKIVSMKRRFFIFALITVGTLPPALASVRNGQANLHIAGLMLQVAAEIHYRRWTRAAVWLTVGIVAKPIMLVMALLSAAVYRDLIWRLAVGVAVVMVVPFACQHPHYVMAQFHDYVRVMNVSSNPRDLYCNIRGLFGKMGWVMPHEIFNGVSAVAAAGMLGCCLFAWRRWPEPIRVFVVFGCSACYLMLFNPRTESNSYVILAPVVALPMAVLLGVYFRPLAAAGLYVLSFMLVCDGWAYRRTENWLKPLTGVVVLGLLVWFVFSGRRRVGRDDSNDANLKMLQTTG